MEIAAFPAWGVREVSEQWFELSGNKMQAAAAQLELKQLSLFWRCWRQYSPFQYRELVDNCCLDFFSLML